VKVEFRLSAIIADVASSNLGGLRSDMFGL